ncbi:calcium-binding and coiled-coil domain-containing protein 2 [Clarias gariepinus]|uniref:calcium-binding and coiled-coil domain-containing protein 2 n=1 Tax=Clarias gariepinus TaxID=13013 RepID=UPI00234C1F3E|nr:calcium-binding and coiled-coil domain-containing protein 2 [Clarias gariepinus]
MSNSTEEDAVLVDMELSVYSQVVFIDVPHAYPLHSDVICSYKLTGGLTPNNKDWIGIYKVGWESTQKYYSYEYTSSEYKGLDPVDQQVVFKEPYLPKDDGEFYQFCYVESSGKVRGASTPFRFQNPAETSVDCSLLVISTPEQVQQMENEKEALLTEIEQLKEGKTILKNELDERLQEICRLRIYIDMLKSNSTDDTFPLKEQPESAKQVISEQSFSSDAMAESKSEESLTPNHEKYEKALLKINLLKQDKVQLEQQVQEKDTEISELRLKAKKLEQDYTRLQDQFQLQQVDMQSIQKEKERLYAEKERKTQDLERVQEENKSLHATFSKQGPPMGDKGDTKMQMLTLTNELTEARGSLRKEILNSKEANKRAEKAELELKELQKQLEKRTVTEESQKETELVEARRRISEQENITEVVRLENEKLSEENKELKRETERLKTLIYDISSGANVSGTQHQQTPLSPVPASPVDTQQQPVPHYYEEISGSFGNHANAENKAKVCRYCQVIFPDITEDELVIHEQSHKVCPFCTLICDDCGQQEFENHVYSHEE